MVSKEQRKAKENVCVGFPESGSKYLRSSKK